jgi:hypothetical protein
MDSPYIIIISCNIGTAIFRKRSTLANWNFFLLKKSPQKQKEKCRDLFKKTCLKKKVDFCVEKGLDFCQLILLDAIFSLVTCVFLLTHQTLDATTPCNKIMMVNSHHQLKKNIKKNVLFGVLLTLTSSGARALRKKEKKKEKKRKY